MAKGPKEQSTGGGVARNMMHVLSDAVVRVRTALLPHEQVEKWRHTTQWLEDLEREMTPFMNQFFSDLKDRDDLPDNLRAMVDQMTNPQHQFGVILNMLGLFSGALALFQEIGPIAAAGLVQTMWQENQNQLLSPDLLSDAVNRGLLGADTAYESANKQGYTNSQVDMMVKLTGEPPGMIDMINLWRWGRIDEPTLDAGLLFSRLNEDYVDMAKMLSQGFMSPADAIELAVKGVVSQEQGMTYFVQAGGQEDQWSNLFEGAGDSIGNEQAIGLYNQGLINEQTLDSVFGRSRLNPIFYPVAELLKHKFLQPFQISSMLKAGTATPEQAAVWLTNLGYGPDQVAAFVGGSPTTTIAKAKSDTEAMILQEYNEGIITQGAAHNALANIGYNADQANMLTDVEDAKVAKSERDTAVSGVKSSFIKGHISTAEASSALDTLGVPSSARDGLITAWGVEQSTQVRVLTEAQIGIAARNGIISYDQAIARWVAQGYSQSDADILAAQYGGGPLATS
jgi:hypothetical protein